MRVHKCLKCDFCCTDVGTFYNHKKRVHGREVPSTSNQPLENALTSPEVSLKEKNPVNILNRFEPETNASPPLTKFHCVFCEKGFVDLSQLSAHETDTHEIPCKLCSTTCYTESDLKFHTEAAHKSIPEVLSPNPETNCIVGGKNFVDSPALSAHEKDIHEILCNCVIKLSTLKTILNCTLK